MCRSTRIRSCCTYAVAVPSTHRVDRHSVCGVDQGGSQHFARMKIGVKLFRIGPGFRSRLHSLPIKTAKALLFYTGADTSRVRAPSIPCFWLR